MQPIWPSYSSTITPDLKTDEKRDGSREEEQVFLEELERLKRQEKDANEEAEALRKELKLYNDSEIPPLEDIYQNSSDGIFTNSSYDDEGAVADFTNLETVVNVSPIPTSRIHSSHPSALILGDLNSAVQTRSKLNNNSDYAAANLDKKSTTGGCQFLGMRLISWQCKKQTIVATSIIEAEYVAAASCCGQVYGYILNRSDALQKVRGFESPIEKRHNTVQEAGSLCLSLASIRSDLIFDDAIGIDSLPNQAICDDIQLMGMRLLPTSERPSEAQPTPSPAHTSEVPFEPHTDSSPAHTSEVPIESQTDPSPRPSPTTIIPDSIPETSGGNLGGHSSSDKSLSGTEGELTLQSVYDLCLSLCAQVSDQAKEIQHLKAQIKKLKKQAKPVIKHHRAWMHSVSLKQRLARKRSSKKQWVHKESVSTDKEKVSTDKDKVSTDRPIVSTDGSKVSTDRQIEGTDEQKVSTDEQIEGTDEQRKDIDDHYEEGSGTQVTQTPTSTIFRDDETIAKKSQGGSKEEESDRKRKLSTRKKMKSRKRRFIQNTSEDDSEKENDELRLHLTIAPNKEKEVNYEILDRKYPIKEWKTKCLGIKPQDDKAEHLEKINQNVVIRNIKVRYAEGFDRVLGEILMVMFNPDDEDEFWNSQQDGKIFRCGKKKYHFEKESTGANAVIKSWSPEEDSTMALA
ncbi:hypothetical protein Tco_1244164 [Tanacetum coccineum]